ncbi:MAG: CHAT domain-containing protein, partial [Caldimonas sp.]
SVAFEVSLGKAPADDTIGRVRLPGDDPEAIHCLQVHLMFGAESAWSELTFSHAGGTLGPARFQLDAPPSGSEPNAVVAVRANFYLGQRWCGEAARNVDVRRDAASPPLASIQAPRPPDWHQGIELEVNAQPPDLVVRILRSGAAGEYRWTCLSPHLALAPPADPADAFTALGNDAETFVKSLLKPLADKWLDALSQAGVDGAGDRIYAATPAVFKQAYWAVWQAARRGGFEFESIQLVTDEPYVPWELMRVADDDIAPDEPPECLAIRHSVGRWLPRQSSGLTQRIAVHSVAVSASDYEQVDSVTQKLPWAGRERALLIDEYHALDVPLRSGPLLAFLNEGQVQAVHFACHGKMSVSAPDTSFLVLEDTPQVLQPPVIGRVETRRGLGRQRPLVFLNACEVGGAASSLDIVAGFPAAFLSAGAAAVVCPLWAVNDERAQRIAEIFYERVLVADGAPLGRVLRDVRAAWRAEGQLTYLAYVLYGDPMARVIYTGPARLRPAPTPAPTATPA